MSRKKNQGESFQVKSHLINALFTMMQKKKYPEIRIIEICEEATIARCTFYRYYCDKDALLNDSCKSVFHELSIRLNQENCHTFYGMSIGFFGFWQNQKNLLSIFYNSNMLGYLSGHFDEFMFDVAREVKPENTALEAQGFSPKVRYHFFFGMGGYWQMMIRWFIHGCKESPEELAQYVVAYLVESFESEPDCQYYSQYNKYPYNPCFIKPGNEI